MDMFTMRAFSNYEKDILMASFASPFPGLKRSLLSDFVP
jgi:hypothetical protein